MSAIDDIPPLSLEMRNIGMRFGENWVLRDVSFLVKPGTVHALVGHNGAGKSTLMKIALGVYTPVTGEVRIGGERLTFTRPAEARSLGLGMVFQETSLIDTLNGLDNLFLNSEVRRGGLIARRPEEEEAAALFERLGMSRFLLRRRVGEMTKIEQEMVEIAKALRLGQKVLILDEPTAPLGREEIATLFEVVRAVARLGTGVVLITHHLRELYEISDEVTCMREGAVVLNAPTSETTLPGLVAAILGPAAASGHLVQERGERPAVVRTEGQVEPVLDVRHLQVGTKLADVSFSVFPGEILGVTGLAGSGRSLLLRTLFGDIQASGGEIEVRGRRYTPADPKEAIARGVYLVPEDRRVHGLVLTKPIVENVVLSILRKLVQAGILRMRQGVRLARDMISLLNIRTRGPWQIAGELSGGNQQKVVLARALVSDIDVLLLDEPTFGVDIGSARDLVTQVRKLAESGKAVVWVTSDLLEILDVADRILVLADGVVRAALLRGDADFSEAALVQLMQREHYQRAG